MLIVKGIFLVVGVIVASKENNIVKLKVTEKGVKAQEEHNTNVRRGKNAKAKGGSYERTIAKKFQARYGVELKRTPQSGGFAKKSDLADDYRGDITIVNPKKVLALHIECKNQKTWSLPAWLKQAEEDCPKDRTPIVVFHKYATQKDYVCLSLDDFLSLVDVDKVIKDRRFR